MNLKSIILTKSTTNAVKMSSLLILIVALSACHGLPIHHGGPSYGHNVVYVPSHETQRYGHAATIRQTKSVEH